MHEDQICTMFKVFLWLSQGSSSLKPTCTESHHSSRLRLVFSEVLPWFMHSSLWKLYSKVQFAQHAMHEHQNERHTQSSALTISFCSCSTSLSSVSQWSVTISFFDCGCKFFNNIFYFYEQNNTKKWVIRVNLLKLFVINKRKKKTEKKKKDRARVKKINK